jgi:OPA family sugar phosphate sensor protein UhpC-like MFS transporter
MPTDTPPVPSPALPKALQQWRWRVFGATWLSYFGLYFCRKPFYVAKADLKEAHGWGPEVLGNIGAAYLLAYAVGQFSTGLLGQRLGPRVVVLAGMAVSLLANAAFGFTASVAVFTGLMVMNGVAQGTGWPANVGTMARWFRRSERGTVMGFWATNFQVGGVAATTLAAWTLARDGYQGAFIWGSVVLAIIWVIFYFNQRNSPEAIGLQGLDDPTPPTNTPDGQANTVSGLDKTTFYTNIALVGGFYFCAKVIRYAIWSWAPYLLRLHYGMDKDDAGYLTNVFDMSGILGVILIGFVSDRFFKSQRVLVSLIFVLGLIASCLALFLVGPTSLTLFTVCMGFIGFCLIAPDSLMTGAGAIDVGSQKQATLAVGLIGTLGALGSVFQELVLGQLLKSDDVSSSFLMLLISAVFAGLCLLVLLLRNRRLGL